MMGQLFWGPVILSPAARCPCSSSYTETFSTFPISISQPAGQLQDAKPS
ncbi:hypothetical protein CORC01_01124 [Colletotrichum orchidophilum]|uniref:Uncharacterized protein n=1 Tax=Colletotrichum orchidophilum TaxID=1209926 RepID=A0A1G4BQ13_9PEZI|nr:uncharacterized protein CORC01_01124 [Colletotrichum orchidophilum]OHF03405.1 hypothetical protein CORC01_01124 [Colletotrichum orchidophilum]